MIEVQREVARAENTNEPFNEDEEAMIKGALSISSTKADAPHIMKPIESVFSLPYTGKMDRPTMKNISNSGFSRVPIYEGENEHNILGYILTKDHIQLNPDDEVPIASLNLHHSENHKG